MTDAEAAPFELHREVVRPEWIDYNGHLNVAFYVRAFDLATDAFFRRYDLYREYVTRSGCSLYALEMHVSYHREMREGDPMRFETRVLDVDAKRLHLYHDLYHATAGYRAASNEIMFAHVAQDSGRVTPFPGGRYAALEAARAAHAALPEPADRGRVIGIRR